MTTFFFKEKPARKQAGKQWVRFSASVLHTRYCIFENYFILYFVFNSPPYAWKSCVPRKGTEGSNPSLCATQYNRQNKCFCLLFFWKSLFSAFVRRRKQGFFCVFLGTIWVRRQYYEFKNVSISVRICLYSAL